MQISIINGSVEYDGEPILSEINFAIHDKEKIAVVGRNGCGKTTLLKALTGEVSLVAGTGDEPFGFFKSGNPIIGYLKQTFDGTETRTLEEELLSSYAEIIKTEDEINLALLRLQADGSENNAKKYASLTEKFEFLGGYTYKKEYKTAAKKFGFSEADLKKPLREFSGGQRTKISLLSLLLSKPQVLLLDEPTNHLDLDAIEWLEKYLSNYKFSCVIVSHDRLFLDRIVNAVYEIEYGETKHYVGNYTDFTVQKQLNYDKELKDGLAKKKEIERLSALVERFRYKATKAKMAQAKLKQIARMGEVKIPCGFDESVFKAGFQPEKESVEKTLILENVSFGYSAESALGEINDIIKRGDKLGIIGGNGCGKSTLIKTIMRIIPPLKGRVIYGLRAEIGYFDQTLTQNYSPLTVFEDFQNGFPLLTNEEVRRALGAFLFSGEDVFKTVGELSGGEKARLALCKIFRKKPNLLILDEPTNHMDIIGKDALEKMLAQYSGTVITVSHDRYFIEKVCDRLAVFENGKLNLYSMKYSEYEKYKPADVDTFEELKTEKIAPIKKEKPVSSDKERKIKLHRIEVLEQKIAVLDKEKATLEKTMSEDESIYSDYLKLAEYSARIADVVSREEPLSEEWASLMEEVSD